MLTTVAKFALAATVLVLFAPSADACCCSGGCGVGQEPASRALAWLPSRGAGTESS